MKKTLSLIVAMMILLCGLTAYAFAADTKVIELGTSGLTMAVPAGYEPGEITAEDTDESQVAYYASKDSLVDFDIYQWAKAEGETLESAANDEAAKYSATAEAITVNGLPCMYYAAVEENEGTQYQTATYLFENGDFLAEIVFWKDGETADAEVDAMINTIAVASAAEITKEGTEIVLGTSALKVTTPVVYTLGEITAEDTDENQVAYYVSEETKVDFDVYQWAKAEGETLESAANAEAADYNATAEAVTIGDLTVMKYDAVEESEGTEYNTVTYIMEDGSDFVEVVFWLDGDNAAETVDAIINTLTK